ncbi:hypothetical protein PHJA_001637400 [Phtheirospermum japonicum]|uniref:Protein downstream neighbor of Son n=1 Tax=Phtheirospermum japonicum TaxID=374723 RepID=A0A830C5M5_9LAMI|nr:hypothetical protein PHJA_001637400 [Phtheirospermum japonicum]
MTKVAAAAQLPASNALHFGGVAGGGGVSKISTTTLKRKTPSELRVAFPTPDLAVLLTCFVFGELLKLKNPVELTDESPSVTSFTRNADGAVSGFKKSDSSKAPRFTRMDEHFPVTKISRLLSRKGTPKDRDPSNYAGTLKNSSHPMDLNAKHKVQNSCLDDTASEAGNDSSTQNSNSTETCIHNPFKSVKELSWGGEKLNVSSSVDMGKALKGLVSCESRGTSAPHSESINRPGHVVPHSFCSGIHIPGHRIPLDLTLKTCMRLLSSSSVNWFHRLINCAISNSMGTFSNVGLTCSSEPTSTSQSHSWVYPQSTLPHAVISALTSAAGVCSAQFVVMFTANDGPSKTKCSSYAYVSQSTRNLRSLLKEHDVSFSMPLCRSKVEEVTAEDLVELSHIEKHNLGQTRAMESLTGVDNTPQSLLMFTGNKNVHALYDFLLNYRFFLTSLTAGDVPVLYSPVPFENAACSTPEINQLYSIAYLWDSYLQILQKEEIKKESVTCKQVRRVDHLSSQLKDSSMDSEPKSSSSGICYSVEVKGAYLPPWVISGICNAMRSNGGDFQVSFSTESTSIGLNVGLDIIAKDQSSQPEKADEQLPENDNPFGIPNTTLSLQRQSAFLKGLKYGDCSYEAFLSPAE